jgi:hypothetical protein
MSVRSGPSPHSWATSARLRSQSPGLTVQRFDHPGGKINVDPPWLTKQGSPGQWHLREHRPTDERLVSRQPVGR